MPVKSDGNPGLHPPGSTPISNFLLRTMAPDALVRFQPLLVEVPLSLGQTLDIAGKPSPYVYFLTSGVCAVSCGPGEGDAVNVGLIGSEGMTGTSGLIAGGVASLSCNIIVPGRAYRIRTSDLLAVLETRPDATRLFGVYFRSLAIQAQYTAQAAVVAKLAERIARLLLMIFDRGENDTLTMTHEALSFMVGVRRSGVTLAMQQLEYLGLIYSRRNAATLRDRSKLASYVGAHYGIPEANYARLIGDFRRKDANGF